MKKLTLIIIVLLSLSMSIIKAQAPNPPYKICFDYDVAGNRIAQKPAWLGRFSPLPPDPNAYFDPDCQCNVPENTKSISYHFKNFFTKPLSCFKISAIYLRPFYFSILFSIYIFLLTGTFKRYSFY